MRLGEGFRQYKDPSDPAICTNERASFPGLTAILLEESGSRRDVGQPSRILGFGPLGSVESLAKRISTHNTSDQVTKAYLKAWNTTNPPLQLEA
jgi:hypothetical protein